MYGSTVKAVIVIATLFFATPAGDKTSENKSAPKVDYIAFQPGEFLRYRMDFNGINGGQATFELKKDSKIIGGEKHFHLYVTGKTNRIVDRIYKVRDVYESYFSEKTLLPSAFFRDVKEGGYKKTEYYLFNQPKGLVKTEEKFHEVDPNQTFDLPSAFYYFRCLDYSKAKPGDKIQVNAFFDGNIFPMGVEYKGKQTIKTSIGRIRCKVFAPMLIKGRIFKEQSSMKIYVSDDKNQIPVHIESDVYMGTISATLIEQRGLKFPFDSLVK
jgi:hypothetical protein